MKTLIALFLTFVSISTMAEVPKKVEIIVPYGAGGASDGAARHFQAWAATRGHNMIVINKPGAQGTIATNDLAQSPKDGSVVTFTAAGVIVMAEKRAGKRLAEPVTVTGVTVQAIVAHPESPYQTFNAFEQGLKTAPNDFMLGWFAIGNLAVLNQIQKNLKVEKDITRVPFKTSADTAHNVMNKTIPLGIIPMAVAKPLIDDGKLRLVMAVAPREFRLPKEIPVITQRFPNWQHQDGFMVALPHGVDENVERAWTALLREYFDQKETHKFYEENFLARAPFGKKHATELINNAEEALKKLEIHVK